MLWTQAVEKIKPKFPKILQVKR